MHGDPGHTGPASPDGKAPPCIDSKKEPCCTSIYHFLPPKPARKGKIVIPTQKQKLEAGTKDIDERAGRILDKGIEDVMRSYYGQ